MAAQHAEMERSWAMGQPPHWTLRAIVGGALFVATAEIVASVADGRSAADDLLGVIGAIGFITIGGLILGRRPGEPVGRIGLGIGMTYGIATILRLVALTIWLHTGPGDR